MPISLYDAIIPSYQQILTAVDGLLGKAEGFCGERKMDPSELVQARLADDMLPFAYQVKSCAVHSLGAIDGVRKGVFSPNMTPPPVDLAGLKGQISDALAQINDIDPAEMDSFVGRDMRFEFGDRRMDFTAENFLLSFSQPNFYFHAATAYDILRHLGVAIGKRDFMGRPRLKG